MTSVSYALRQVKYSLSFDTLKLIHCAHVHSIIGNGVIFWGNSSGAKKVFQLQNKLSELSQTLGQVILVKKFSRTCK
jgi:hypothetical protein